MRDVCIYSLETMAQLRERYEFVEVECRTCRGKGCTSCWEQGSLTEFAPGEFERYQEDKRNRSLLADRSPIPPEVPIRRGAAVPIQIQEFDK